MLLHKNITALREHNPLLAKRLTWPVSGDHIIEKDGKVGYVLHDTAFPIELSVRVLQRIRQQAPHHQDILLWGCEEGELLDILLEKHNRVVVWERDPWLLRRLLNRRNFTPFLESGQLEFLLGADICARRVDLSKRILIAHPFFASLYRLEKSLIENPHAPVALLCRGELFVQDVAKDLLAKGYAILQWDVESLSHDEILYCAMQAHPRLAISINYRYGLAEIAQRLGFPLCIWEVDPFMDEIRHVEGDVSYTYIFTFRKENILAFTKAGFHNVSWLPLATNPNRCHPKPATEEEKKRFATPVSFVGASLAESGRHYRKVFEETYARWSGRDDIADLVDEMKEQQATDWSCFCIRELIQEYVPDFALVMENAQVSLVSLLGEYVASEKRKAYVQALEEYGIQVWGDRYWGWSQGYRGRAGHLQEVVDIYRNSDINIDINRIYQPDIVTMRVFDVIASGGFILSEYTPELSELFVVGEEIETYRNLDELREKVKFYLANPDKRQKFIDAGRKRVLAEHTMHQRVDTMLQRAGFQRES